MRTGAKKKCAELCAVGARGGRHMRIPAQIARRLVGTGLGCTNRMETTFADVLAYTLNPANQLTVKERASQKRESARRNARDVERAAELGISVESYVSGEYLWAQFE